MNLLVAFVILFGLALGMRDYGTRSARSSRARRPPSSSKPAIGSSRSTASVPDARSRIGSRGSATLATHKCAGKQVDGCRARTPAT